jgi:hypothetical protein
MDARQNADSEQIGICWGPPTIPMDTKDGEVGAEPKPLLARHRACIAWQGLTSTLSGGQHTPRSGIVLLHVRDAQLVKHEYIPRFVVRR